MRSLTLSRPAASQQTLVAAEPDSRITLNFPADQASLERAGDDLLFSFDDGSSIRIENFYSEYNKDNAPDFEIDGQLVSSADFFSAFGPDLAPAAGPAAGAERSARYSQWGDSALMDGVDHLNGLDIGFDGSGTDSQSENGLGFFASASPTAGTTIPPLPPEPNEPPEIGAHTDHLRLKESGVGPTSTSSNPNTPIAGTPSAKGQIYATDPDARDVLQYRIEAADADTASSITSNTMSNGVQTIVTSYGVLVLNTNDVPPTYTYTIDQGKCDFLGVNDPDIEQKFNVVVSDGRGGVVKGEIAVTIEGTNDRPIITITDDKNGQLSVTEDVNTAASGTYVVSDPDSDGHWATGADNTNHSYSIHSGSGTSGNADNGDFGETSTFSTKYGTLTVNPDGSYSYTLNNDSSEVQRLGEGQSKVETFEVTVTDKWGANSSQTITVTINGTNDAPEIDISSGTLTLKESGVGAQNDPNVDNSGQFQGHAGNNYTIKGTSTAKESFSVSDNDSADVLTATLTDSDGNAVPGCNAIAGANGTWTITTEHGILTIIPHRTVNSATGEQKIIYEYTYKLDNAKADHLAEGDTVDYKFTVSVTDGHSAPKIHDINIHIEGTNDRPYLALENAQLLKDSGVHNGNEATSDTQNKVDSGSGSYQYEKTVINGQLNNPDALGNNIIDKDDGATHTYRVVTETGWSTKGVTEVSSVKLGGTAQNTNVPNGLTNTVVSEDAGQVVIKNEYGTLVLKADGSYTFELDTTEGGAADKLPQGATITMTFPVMITDDKGATSVNNLNITVVGTNDRPELADLGQYDLTENTEAFQVEGTAEGSDVDHGAVLTYSITDANGAPPTVLPGAVIQGKYGTLTLDPATGKYTYTLNNSLSSIQELKNGDVVEEVFTVTVKDEHGASDSKQLVINIHGQDNAPAFIVPAEVFQVRESGVGTVDAKGNLTNYYGNEEYQGSGTISGKAQAVDVDKDDTENLKYYFLNSSGGRETTLVTTYGTVTIDPDTGEYTYTLNDASEAVNKLQANEHASDGFTIVAVDPNGNTGEMNITVNIVGTNDRPELKDAIQDRELREDSGSYVTTGQVEATDVDLPDGEKLIYSLVHDGNTVQTIEGKYGYIQLDTFTGKYTYHLYNDKVQFLSEGQSVDDTFVVRVTDNLGAFVDGDIKVTIHGTQDDPTMETAVLVLDEDTAQSGTRNIVWHDKDDDDDLLRITADGKDLTGNDSVEIVGKFGTLTLHADGTYSYKLNTGDVQYLNVGDSEKDVFNVKLTTGHTNGAGQEISSSVDGTITVIITGTNDAPVFTAKEWQPDGPATSLQTSGQVWATDVDNKDYTNDSSASELKFYFEKGEGDDTQYVQTIEGKYGSITINTLTGEYTYHLNIHGSAYKGLGKDVEVSEEFAVGVIDPHGAKDNATITINVIGKGSGGTGGGGGDPTDPIDPNDPGGNTPSDTLKVTDLDVKEDVDADGIDDGYITASGKLTLKDGGDPTDQFYLKSSDGTDAVLTNTGLYGSLILKPDGSYTYVLNNDSTAVQSLRDGDKKTETFTVYHPKEGKIDITVTVEGTNDQPRITTPGGAHENGQDIAKTEGVTGKIVATDIDAGDTLSYFLKDKDGNLVDKIETEHGVITIDKNTGEYKYLLNSNHGQLNADQTVKEVFTVVAQDNSGNTASDTSAPTQITITITGDNTPPTVTVTNLTVTEDSALSDSSQVQVADDVSTGTTYGAATSNTGPLQTVVQGQYGTLIINRDTGNYTYTLNNGLDAVQGLHEGQQLTETFYITVTDKHGASVVEPLDVTVKGTNDAPVLFVESGLSIAEGEIAVSGQSQVHDKDANETHTFSHSGAQGNDDYGTFTIDANGKYTFTLDNDSDAVKKLALGQSVDLTYTVTVTDIDGLTDQRDVVITITGTNNAPEVKATVAEVTEDDIRTGPNGSEMVFASGHIEATDPDAGAQLQYFVKSNGQTDQIARGSYGTLTISSVTGQYLYVLNNADPAVQALGRNDSMTETFTVVVRDEHGKATETQLTVTINGANDAPVITSAPGLTVTEDTVLTSSGKLIFTDVDATDTHTFGVSTKDGQQGESAAGKYGTLTIDSNGNYTYTLDNSNPDVQKLAQGESTTEIFTVYVSDGAETVQKDIVVTIKGTNTSPTIESFDPALAVTEGGSDASGTVVGADVDNGARISYYVGNDNATNSSAQKITGQFGTLSIDNNGKYTYSLIEDKALVINPGEVREETFTIFVKDEHGALAKETVTISVTGTESTPVISVAADLTVKEDEILDSHSTVTVLDDARDMGNHTFGVSVAGNGSFAGTAAGAYGKLVIDANGTYTYYLDNDLGSVQSLGKGESVEEHFTIQVTDPQGNSTTKDIVVKVEGTNDAPAISSWEPVGSDITEGSGLAITGTVIATDVDANDVLSYFVGAANAGSSNSQTYKGTYGTVTIAADGTYSYVLHAGADKLSQGQQANETFAVLVSDGKGGWASKDVTVNITGTNNTPVLEEASGSIYVPFALSGSQITGQLQGHDVDANDVLTYGLQGGVDDGSGSITLQGQYGTLTIDSATGQYTYELDMSNPTVQHLGKGSTLNETFTTTVHDGWETVNSKLEITVNSDHTVKGLDTPGILYGDSSDNLLLGSGGDDIIKGGIGNEALFGGEGNDILYGGAGNDYLDGGSGSNQLYGGEGNDVLVFSASNTVMDGGTGIDMMIGADKDTLDSLFANPATNTIQNIEIFVTEGGKGLTSLADLENLGVLLNNNEKIVLSSDWNVNTDQTPSSMSNDYVAFTNDSMTILVAKAALAEGI